MSKLKTLWKIPELQMKILFTLGMLLVFRLGCAIPVPFINPETLTALFSSGNTFDYMNMMSGGALSQCTLFALGVTPYINASIIVQLLCVIFPRLGEAKKDETGQKLIEKITSALSIGFAVALSIGYMLLLSRYGALKYTSGASGVFAMLVITVCFVAGSQIALWLGKKIDENGIGNGVSLLIFAGIVARWSNVIGLAQNAAIGVQSGNWALVVGIVLAVVFLLVSLWFVVYVDGSARRIPVMYAGRVSGRYQQRGIGSHIPLKLMISGVMPVIFASTVLSVPQTVALFINAEKYPGLVSGLLGFNTTSWLYCVLYVAMIFFFNYFYVSVQYDVREMANTLRTNGGMIPGHRPGKPTSDFIGKAMKQIAGTGSVALALIAITPILVQNIAGVYVPLGGTALMIVVSVATELVKKLDGYVVMRNHKGFLA